MNSYLPEGMQIHTARHIRTLDDLHLAMDQGEIIAATAVLCDEGHNLHVSMGGLSGIIPRREAALGVAEGTVRDIAILSRVGKTVCCKVVEIPREGDVILSRVAAQREALSHLLATARPGDVLPAVVTNLTEFGAFCDIGCGVPALLGIETLCVSRVSHSRERFHQGQQIYAVIKSIDEVAKRINLSHRELLGTWKENASLFRPGQTVMGVVRSVKDYGVFVELTANLSGLGEPNPDLSPGDGVSVYIKAILPEKGKIKLVTLEKLDPNPLPTPLRYMQTSGHMDTWKYSPTGNIATTF